ncbi:lamin tail domain-containing protein [Candidatus Woesearchaeota archaeon]|nr:MAG: lamin tail domain-containing protein [Candidatus Woesearchaeota archaeon]
MIILLLLVGFARADLKITEIMFDPVISQTDGEWVEIYNNASYPIDLTGWKLDGYDFDDVVIFPGQYVVIARELVDGVDKDNESFESYYGNNNGVWDDGFVAVDGYMSLKLHDSINLTNMTKSVAVSYNLSVDKGKTIVLVNGSFVEGKFNGTPGRGEDDNIGVEVNIINVKPVINNVTVEDDFQDNGIQILPGTESYRNVKIKVNVTDKNGIEDIKQVYVEVFNRKYELTLNNSIYTGSFVLYDNDSKGEQSLRVFVDDGNEVVNETLSFEFFEKFSAKIKTPKLVFSEVIPGQYSEEETVEIEVSKNLKKIVEISNFYNVNDMLDKKYFEVYDGEWLSLDEPRELFGNELRFRLNLPENVPSGKFNGFLKIVMEK